MTDYIKPRSLTFWAGLFMILEGVLVGTLNLHGQAALVDTINTLTGEIGPAALIANGAALIGLRRAVGE